VELAGCFRPAVRPHLCELTPTYYAVLDLVHRIGICKIDQIQAMS
jgi:hypothetical protein